LSTVFLKGFTFRPVTLAQWIIGLPRDSSDPADGWDKPVLRPHAPTPGRQLPLRGHALPRHDPADKGVGVGKQLFFHGYEISGNEKPGLASPDPNLLCLGGISNIIKGSV